MTIRLHGRPLPQMIAATVSVMQSLRLPHDLGGQILVAQSGGVFGEPDGFVAAEL